MTTKSRSFLALALLAAAASPLVGCANTEVEGAATADESISLDQIPKCEGIHVGSTSILADAVRSERFFVVPDRITISNIVTSQPSLTRAEEVPEIRTSPLFGHYSLSFEIEARAGVDQDALVKAIQAYTHKSQGIDLRSIDARQKRPAQVELAGSGAKITSEVILPSKLRVAADYSSFDELNLSLSLFAERVGVGLVSMPFEFDCVQGFGLETHEFNVNGSGASMTYEGEGISVSNEAQVLDSGANLMRLSLMGADKFEAYETFFKLDAATLDAFRAGMRQDLADLFSADQKRIRDDGAFLLTVASNAESRILNLYAASLKGRGKVVPADLRAAIAQEPSGTIFSEFRGLLEAVAPLRSFKFATTVRPFRR